MEPKRIERIGILGGTFDPVHEGHMALARAALKQLRLDRLVFVPAFKHPLPNKESKTVASAEHRLKMTQLAIGGEPKFEVSDCEIKRKGISYTIDTLKDFCKRYPKPNELFFITGGDWGKALDQWKDIDAIFSLARFVVAKRPGFATKDLPKEVYLLDFVPLNISSTEVRTQLSKGTFKISSVPPEVLAYVQKYQLYR